MWTKIVHFLRCWYVYYFRSFEYYIQIPKQMLEAPLLPWKQNTGLNELQSADPIRVSGNNKETRIHFIVTNRTYISVDEK